MVYDLTDGSSQFWLGFAPGPKRGAPRTRAVRQHCGGVHFNTLKVQIIFKRPSDHQTPFLLLFPPTPTRLAYESGLNRMFDRPWGLVFAGIINLGWYKNLPHLSTWLRIRLLHLFSSNSGLLCFSFWIIPESGLNRTVDRPWGLLLFGRVNLGGIKSATPDSEFDCSIYFRPTLVCSVNPCDSHMNLVWMERKQFKQDSANM